MIIEWAVLGQVCLYSFAAAVGVIVLFSFGATVLAPAGNPDRSGTPADGSAATTTRSPASIAIAGLCFLVCALVVAYGIYLIIAK